LDDVKLVKSFSLKRPDEIGHKFFRDDFTRGKNIEIRADLYTLRNPRIARDNLNSLKKMQKLFPLEIEVSQNLLGSQSTHPYFFERIQYMTEGLCGLYPDQNQDIC
jgi:hypothetical protein